MKFKEFWKKLIDESNAKYGLPSTTYEGKTAETLSSEKINLSKIDPHYCSHFQFFGDTKLSLTFIDNSDSTGKCIDVPYVMLEILWNENKDTDHYSWYTESLKICKTFQWEGIEDYDSKILSACCTEISLGLLDLIRFIGVTERE